MGHSTLDQDAFVRLLVRHGIEILVDVRSHPGSSHYPQFNTEQMRGYVPEAGVRYEWEPRLGGWRDIHAELDSRFKPYGVDVSAYVHSAFPKQRIARRIATDQTVAPECPQHGYNKKLALPGECCCPSESPVWYVCGFYDYSFYMMLPEFAEGAQWLYDLALQSKVAIMCSEGRYFSCHRSMISDYMWFRYELDSKHIPSVGRTHSSVLGNRLMRYHADILEAWRAGRDGTNRHGA